MCCCYLLEICFFFLNKILDRKGWIQMGEYVEELGGVEGGETVFIFYCINLCLIKGEFLSQGNA